MEFNKNRLTKLFHSAKSHAKKKKVPFNIDKDYLETLWIGCGGYCPVTGIKLESDAGTIQNRNPRGASLDRIIPSKGYAKGNVRIVSSFYNNAKHSYSDAETLNFMKLVVERAS